MISVTKIFRFEAAHALYQYPGSCAQIHGHSYELHVTVRAREQTENYIPGLGIAMDFKLLKAIVQDYAVRLLDHRLVLSRTYLAESGKEFSKEELVEFEVEPTAENLLLFLRDKIIPQLPKQIQLTSLKLCETADSYAEWSA